MSAGPHRPRVRSQLIIDLKQRDCEVLIVREPDHPGHSVLCPELGCASQGDTREEARAMMAEAISLCLGACIDRGEPPPLRPDAMAE